MKKYIAGVILLLAVIAAVAATIYFQPFRRDSDVITVGEGRMASIASMVRLCAVEIYNEEPVLDTINSKVIFAIQKQRGSISFDLEKLVVEDDGDTLTIILPPEIVEIYEATDPASWDVVDTKAIGPMALLRSDRFSDREENAVKARIRKKAVRRLYRNGTVARARAEGAERLQSLLSKIYRRPVKVTDPTPRGARSADSR